MRISGILRRCEQTEDLSAVAHKAGLIVVLDATCPEIMTDFNHLLKRSKEISQKPMLFVDPSARGSP